VATSLVTGADGFVGQHLVAALSGRGERVVGGIRGARPDLTTLSSSVAESIRWVTFDLEDRRSVHSLVRVEPIDRVYHLGGLASAAKSITDPAPPFRVNVIGTLYLLEELATLRDETGRVPAILIPGSGDVYGRSADRLRPLTEDAPLEPLNAYAVSKASQEMLGLQYQRARGLPVVVARSFNHTGPGQRPPYVAPQFAHRLLELRRAGGAGRMPVGDLEVRRDFTDVRDVVRAYIRLLDTGAPGTIYNVCSGRAIPVGRLLEILAEATGVWVEPEVRNERVRPGEPRVIVGSFERLERATDWRPEIELRRTLTDLVAALEG
jgi:GDP-4-dehydro-6-deoxy-D-mannose reductase